MTNPVPHLFSIFRILFFILFWLGEQAPMQAQDSLTKGFPDPSQIEFVSLEAGWGNIFEPAKSQSAVFEIAVGIPLRMWLF